MSKRTSRPMLADDDRESKTNSEVIRKNADLYEAGKQYATVLPRLMVGGKKKAACDVAAECDVPAEEVREAIAFADAVNQIAANCGDGAKALILSYHPRLPAEVVMKISRTHAERQRLALRQAEADRDPLGKPPPGVEPPFDTHNPAEVLNRLGRNAGALNCLADGLLNTAAAQWPPPVKLVAVLDRATYVRRLVRAMKPWVASSAVAPPAVAKKQSRRKDRREREPFNPTRTLSTVAQVAGVTEKNHRDLPRVLAETPPTAVEKDSLLAGLGWLDAAAARLIAVVNARGHDPRTGPSEVPGTYVVIYRLPKTARRLTIGALGVFDFPAGYYAYIGSACGGGGVRKRTHRHLTRRSERLKWNVDHLKPLCTPVAVWWTHDGDKVEFDWADLLADLPGASVPAPRFGGNDNPSAEAHLFRFNRMPSVTDFRRRVNEAMPGHAPVHAKTVSRWTGHGWPE